MYAWRVGRNSASDVLQRACNAWGDEVRKKLTLPGQEFQGCFLGYGRRSHRLMRGHLSFLGKMPTSIAFMKERSRVVEKSNDGHFQLRQMAVINAWSLKNRCHIRRMKGSLGRLRNGAYDEVFVGRSWSWSRLLSPGLSVVPLMPQFPHPLQPWLSWPHSVVCQPPYHVTPNGSHILHPVPTSVTYIGVSIFLDENMFSAF